MKTQEDVIDSQVQKGRISLPSTHPARGRDPQHVLQHVFHSRKTLAKCNLCSGLAMAVLFIWLSEKMDLYIRSWFILDILYFTEIYLPFPTSVIQASNKTPPVLIFALFMLAALIFSMTLTAWCFLEEPVSKKGPRKLLCFTIVALSLGMTVWVGVTVEEFCLIAVPVLVGVGLFLASVVIPGKTTSKVVQQEPALKG